MGEVRESFDESAAVIVKGIFVANEDLSFRVLGKDFIRGEDRTDKGIFVRIGLMLAEVRLCADF